MGMGQPIDPKNSTMGRGGNVMSGISDFLAFAGAGLISPPERKPREFESTKKETKYRSERRKKHKIAAKSKRQNRKRGK